jgi:hypothetical protein
MGSYEFITKGDLFLSKKTNIGFHGEKKEEAGKLEGDYTIYLIRIRAILPGNL